MWIKCTAFNGIRKPLSGSGNWLLLQRFPLAATHPPCCWFAMLLPPQKMSSDWLNGTAIGPTSAITNVTLTKTIA